jgi:hypothetical protein
MVRRRLIVLLCLGIAAFYAGNRFIIARPAPARQPLTGREIAGIATDTGWLDRDERETEEEPELALTLIEITPGLVVADVGLGAAI